MTYTLSGPGQQTFAVRLEFSLDNGRTFATARTVAGDVGIGIRGGEAKQVTWRAGNDLETIDFNQLRYRIAAEPERRTPPRPAIATGALEVTSDPPDADVYFDSVLRGRTPIRLDNLTVGEHRVRIAKDGFLENARTITVDAGSPASIVVKLTGSPAPGDANERQTQPATSPRRGGGNKLKWILPAVGGGAAAAGLAASKKGPPPNQPPVFSGITPSPTGAALAVVTEITFNLNGASDPEGDPLTITWTFGDGGTSSGASVRHFFQNAGTFIVVARISDGSHEVSTSVSATARTVNGTWSGRVTGTGGAESGNTTFQLTQVGSSVTGTQSTAFDGSTSIKTCQVSGSVANVRVVSLTGTSCVNGNSGFTYAGDADEALNRITGTVGTQQTFVLSRQ